jgi:hypothetical protein
MSSKKLLGFDIDKLIKESIQGLFEVAEDESSSNMKEKLKQQQQIQDKKRRQKIYSGKKEDTGDEADEAIKPEKPVKIKHEKVPDITAKSIKNVIDSIRSGKSLKDKETMGALKEYFQKLNGPERIALFAFLKGLDKILGKQSAEGPIPHEKPYDIDMEQDQEVEAPGKKNRQPKGTKEISTSKESETPIIVGERADIRSIKSRLWRK